MEYGFEMELLGCHQGESIRQIESHLITENAHRSRSRPVGFPRSLTQYMVEEIKILLHRLASPGYFGEIRATHPPPGARATFIFSPDLTVFFRCL